MGPRSTTEETVARWAVTATFVGCAGGLMWALGSSLGVWAGLGLGVVLSGLVGGRLWSAHLDNVAIARDKADNVATGTVGRGYRAEPDEDQPQQPAQRAQSGGYYDEDDD